jgi:Tol biopolymer transport system component
VHDLQRDTMTRLTFGGHFLDPIWTPDGRNVVFGVLGNGLMWTRADGADQPQPLLNSDNATLLPWSFSPDGKRLAYMGPSDKQLKIWIVPVENQDGQLKAGKPEKFLKTQFTELGPAFSPDGRWLAYSSTESGQSEVYVRAFPIPVSGQGGRWQISNAGGDGPQWSGNGHELLYSSQHNDQVQLMAVRYTVTGDTFVAEKPRVWLDKLGGADWTLAPDGKRVAVVTPVAAPEAPKTEHEVTFLFNFFDELRRKVPLTSK